MLSSKDVSMFNRAGEGRIEGILQTAPKWLHVIRFEKNCGRSRIYLFSKVIRETEGVAFQSDAKGAMEAEKGSTAEQDATIGE